MSKFKSEKHACIAADIVDAFLGRGFQTRRGIHSYTKKEREHVCTVYKLKTKMNEKIKKNMDSDSSKKRKRSESSSDDSEEEEEEVKEVKKKSKKQQQKQQQKEEEEEQEEMRKESEEKKQSEMKKRKKFKRIIYMHEFQKVPGK